MDVGVLHPGEMGARVGAVARGRVWWAPEGRSEATAVRAREAGLWPAPLDDLLGRCEVVLAICPPHGAPALADEVARRGFTGLYCDANAISPETVRRIAAAVERAGATFVDGGIVGGPPREPGTRLYLSGPAAEGVAGLFEDTALEPVVLGGEIGRASALKMLYAAWSKASAALLLAIGEAAERLELAEELRAEWERSVPGLVDAHARAIASADEKGWRWVAEMREIEATLRSVGLPGGFHAAAADIFAGRA